MYRVRFPFTDTLLVLTPPLESLPGWLQLVFAVGGLLLAVGLLVWLYGYEARLIRPPVALGLLVLRGAVLALLAFVCLQPVVSRPTRERITGRVLIALDRSDSMGVADPQRDNFDKIRLARGLHLAGDLCRDEQLDGWLKQYTEKGQANFAPTPAGEQERLLHNQVCGRVDALSRLQIAKQVLVGERVNLVRGLEKQHGVEIAGFSQEIGDLTAEEIAALTAHSSKSSPTAFTDLRLPLQRALERSGPDRGKVLGVVLLTDGQHNWGPQPSAKAVELGKLGVPIYPIALGSTTPPTDIAVTMVQAPTAVFKNAEVPVEARIQVNGLSAREILVTLNREGLPPLEERIQHDGKTSNYTVRFQPKMEEVGTQTMTVTVRPEREELRTDNNSKPLVVNVADDKAKVMLIDGEARWEFHYLASALARDRSMQVKNVVFSQPRLNAVTSEEELQQIGYPALKLPAEPDALNGYDCIILGDVSPDQLPLPERQRLERYVAERGGTLVFLAGKRHMPQSFGTTPAERETDPLWRLLPIQEPREVKPVDGFPISLTAEGRLSAFLQMESTSEMSDRRWAELPKHYWGLVGKAKPGAVTLAWYRDPSVKADAKPDAERERANALIVRQHYGFGRVVYVGLDSTWRWRLKTGDTYHHRFWGQVIRWAASDKPLVTGNEYVRFGTREPLYRSGQEIELVVRMSDLARTLGPNALAGARLYRLKDGAPDENAGLVPLTRRENRPRELEAKLRDLAPGKYAVELAIPDLADQLQPPAGPDGRKGKMRSIFTVSPPDTAEMVDLATNRPLLDDLAQRSGGQVFEPEDAGQLVEKLQKALAVRQYRTETRLWRSAWTLALFLLLLTGEWVTRKLVGLP
ncbi:MAG: hypothetical protein ACJ8F7_16925 [Gemmataceae bacterium]